MSVKGISKTKICRMLVAVSGLSVAIALAAPAAYAQEAARQFDVPAQPLGRALLTLGRQAGISISAPTEITRGRTSQPVSGRMTTREALARMLEGSGLSFQFVGASAVRVYADSRGAGSAAAENESAQAGAISEILVTGRRTNNVDIRRTEDDAQPYVVFDRQQIQDSQVDNLNDFFRTRLPMNATAVSASQTLATNGGTRSEINLRGLGSNQTLILVDGRRMPGFNAANQGIAQPDINGIPLAAIERIEVLPATAGGIYGGSATGGVINIITKRDYSGIDISARYGNTDRWDDSEYRLDVAAGLNLEGGRTHVMFSGSYSSGGTLLNSERDFLERARALQFSNNPSSFRTLTVPPFGLTTNICTAASATATTCSTAPLVLRNGQSLGSNSTFVPVGYGGAGSDGGAALVANAGQYNLANTADTNGGAGPLLAAPTTASANVNIRREFSERVEVYADLSWLRNEGSYPFIAGLPSAVTIPAGAPNNPFNSAIRVRFPSPGLTAPVNSVNETTRALGGVLVRMPFGWSANLDYIWARSRSSGSFTSTAIGDPDGAGPGQSVTAAFQNGTLDLLRDLNAFPLDYGPYLLPSPNNIVGPLDTIINNGSFRLSGPLIRLPGGNLTLTGLIEYRDESQRASYQDSPGITIYIPEREQSAWSYSLEGRLPLISSQNATWFANTLEVQASVRHDTYRTTQPSPIQISIPSRESPLPDFRQNVNHVSATSFTVGLLYKPIPDVTLRASYATGFLPPNVTQLVPGARTRVTGTLADPKRGGVLQSTDREQVLGGNPDLLPEQSTSWSAGLIVTPRFIPGFRLSVDYTRIGKVDEIRAATVQDILDLEDLFPGRVVRGPLEPNAPAGYTAGPILFIDGRSINAARTKVEAVDFQADYSTSLGTLGDIHFYGVATWAPTLRRRFLPNTPFIESVGYSGGVLDWRLNAGFTWTKDSWTLGWNSQFYDSYLVYGAQALPLTPAQQTSRDQLVLSQGSARIRSQIYSDIFIRYRFGERLNNSELAFGVQNLFDQSPSIIATTASTGGYSTYADPRLRRFTLSVRTHF